MVTVDVAQVSVGLDYVSHAALQLLGLGEAPVDRAVPEHAVLRGGGRRASWLRLWYIVFAVAGGGGWGHGGGKDLDDEGPACGRLQGYFAQPRGEGREELLGILVGELS